MLTTKYLVALIGIAVIAIIWISCSTPKGQRTTAPVVQNFDINQYLGQWYEIARFDFKFEKDLKNVTATYSQREDGKIKVLNRGFDYVKNKWKEANGKAKFANNKTEGALKVSFFGPFYAAYNVVMLDDHYQTALVFGESTEYMWILSRTKSISEDTKQRYLAYAKQNGYDLSRLVWTKQE